MIDNLDDVIMIPPSSETIKNFWGPDKDVEFIRSSVEANAHKLITLKINAKIEFGIKPEKYFDEGHNIWR